jgi:hypothetical protein
VTTAAVVTPMAAAVMALPPVDEMKADMSAAATNAARRKWDGLNGMAVLREIGDSGSTYASRGHDTRFKRQARRFTS